MGLHRAVGGDDLSQLPVNIEPTEKIEPQIFT
jgi:hypothetical protein